MNKEPHVVVVGAINVDIKGRPYKNLAPRTSNPGTIEITPGGVGRNIAENLVKLQVNTTMLSVVGDDPFYEFIMGDSRRTGINLEHVRTTSDHSNGLFLAFIDQRGDLVSAITDMSIMSDISPDYLKTKEDIIETADYIIMDVDIPGESIDYLLNLAKKHNINTCVEPVSAEKTNLMLPFLDRITMVTPNREEAEVLAGFPIRGAKGVIEAGEAIYKKGVELVIITLGAEGVYLCSKKMRRFISSISTVVEDTVGAGDSMAAGMIYALCNGKSIYDAIRTGIAAATLTLTTKHAVHPELNPGTLDQILSRRRW